MQFQNLMYSTSFVTVIFLPITHSINIWIILKDSDHMWNISCSTWMYWTIHCWQLVHKTFRKTAKKRKKCKWSNIFRMNDVWLLSVLSILISVLMLSVSQRGKDRCVYCKVGVKQILVCFTRHLRQSYRQIYITSVMMTSLRRDTLSKWCL